MYQIKLKLNGEQRSAMVDASDILLDVLRDKLGAKSVKCGCERGDCGACAVLLNGKSVRSCLVFAVETNGMEITTVEGLSDEKGMSLLQKTFHEFNAFQCGFCAPGIIISATELINHNPHPSKDEIKEAISGNLCRCTGYQPIIDSIEHCTAKKKTSSKKKK